MQVGDGVAVIAVTSAANMSMIVAAWLWSATRLVTISWGGARITAFLLVLVAAALMPAPVRAGEELNEPGAERVGPSPSSA
jgi:hypothetical protein